MLNAFQNVTFLSETEKVVRTTQPTTKVVRHTKKCLKTSSNEEQIIAICNASSVIQQLTLVSTISVYNLTISSKIAFNKKKIDYYLIKKCIVEY